MQTPTCLFKLAHVASLVVDQRTMTAFVVGLAIFHNVATAQQLLSLFVCTLYACNLLKATMRLPRPSLKLVAEQGYGFPSSHAAVALAVGLWWAPATCTGRSTAVLVAVLIGISRLVLLVHFPVDVIGGWLVGFGACSSWNARGNVSARWMR